jgi:hypothetical protein
MAQTEYYGRSPLPAETRTPTGLMMLLWAAVIFSPFVAFTVNGKVDDSDWTPALVTAGVALFALVLLSARAHANYRNLPAHLRDEYERGKSYAVLSAARVRLPRDFKLAADASVQLTSSGVAFSPAALQGQDGQRRAALVRTLWRAMREGRTHTAAETIAWRDIKEWEVHDGGEGSDYYRLPLADGGHVCLHRPADTAEEYELLDTVRGAGHVPVRVFCDIPRPRAGH